MSGSDAVSVVRRFPAVFVGVLVFLVLAPIAARQPSSYDGSRMKTVAVSLADHATPLVVQDDDAFGLNSPYSTYGIGMSLAMAPLYLLGRVAGTDGASAMNLAGALFFAATCAVVIEILRRRGHSARVIAITAVVVTLGTPLLAYSVTDFSEPGVALMVACAVLALDGMSRRARFAALGVGASVGGAVLFRTDSIVLIAIPVAVAGLLVSRDRRRDTLWFAVGALPAAIIWLAYNAARFGSPFDGGYRYQTFSTPFLTGLYGLTLSPGRGVLIYVPIVVVALVVTPRLRGSDRVIGWLAVVLLVVRVLFYARWWAWYGGNSWGPRFLVPVLPAFAPVIAAALVRWPRAVPIAAAALLGIVLSTLGLLVVIDPARNAYVPPDAPGTGAALIANSTLPAYQHRIADIMFDWSRFPLRR